MSSAFYVLADCSILGTADAAEKQTMAHSARYQITDSVRSIEIEVGKLLDLVVMLKEAGDEELSSSVALQANRLLDAAVALRMALAAE